MATLDFAGISRQFVQYHPRVGHTFVPGVRARVPHETGGYLIRVNQSGFRSDAEFEARKGRRRLRALLFGDSFTAGDGVSNGKRYGDILERELPDLEVYNFGLPGSGTDQQYLLWQEYATRLEHDVVVLGLYVENIRRVVARYRRYIGPDGAEALYAKPYFTLEDGSLRLHQVPVPREPLPADSAGDATRGVVNRGGRFPALRALVGRTGLKPLAQRLTRYQPVPEYGRTGDPAWRLLRAIVLQWARESRVPMLVVPIPMHQHIERTAGAASVRARFAELAGEGACAVHDPLPDLWQRAPEVRRSFRFAQDAHFTPAGHAALAASLAPALRTLLGTAK
ncbi:MAG: SGNH/GDSL hydrolase family protein [Betaproteobacteria bacterium]